MQHSFFVEDDVSWQQLRFVLDHDFLPAVFRGVRRVHGLVFVIGVDLNEMRIKLNHITQR